MHKIINMSIVAQYKKDYSSNIIYINMYKAKHTLLCPATYQKNLLKEYPNSQPVTITITVTIRQSKKKHLKASPSLSAAGDDRAAARERCRPARREARPPGRAAGGGREGRCA